jgi:apolipoprotein N-acyltransferase
MLTWRFPRWRAWLGGAVAVAVWALVPAWGSVTSAQGQLRVAAVQGNANAGLFSNETPGTILRNHLDAAEAVVDEDFDVMVWPENAVDLDVLRNASARAAVTEFVDRMGRPLVLGSVTTRGDDVYNSVIVWLPGVGPTQVYDKRHPVPFAEYMPDRWLWRPLAPDLVDLVPRGFSFGQASGNLDVAGVNAGVLICFETSDSDLVRGLVSGGAQVILAPTNNADFGHSDEAAQQLAITRAQAVAAGRSVVNVSTVSSSAIIDAGGAQLASLEDFTSGAMIATVRLHDAWAPSQLMGPVVEVGALLIAAGALVQRATLRVRRGRTAPDQR